MAYLQAERACGYLISKETKRD